MTSERSAGVASAAYTSNSVRVRLFIAVMPSEDVVEHLDEAVQRLLRLRAQDSDVRWVPPPQWHVTLVFLGEVPDEATDDLVPVLDDVMAHCHPPELQLAGAGAFGGKVLYAGVVDPRNGGQPSALGVLAARARDVVTGRRIAVDSRPFRAHLTLARARGGRASFVDIERGLHNYRSPAWTANEVVLVQSEPGPRGRGNGVVHRTLSTSVIGPSP